MRRRWRGREWRMKSEKKRTQKEVKGRRNESTSNDEDGIKPPKDSNGDPLMSL